MNTVPLDFLGLLGVFLVVAVALVIGRAVIKQRRVKRLENPRKDYLK